MYFYAPAEKMCKQSKNEQCRNHVCIKQYYYPAIWVTMKAKGQVWNVDLKNTRVVNLKIFFLFWTFVL